MILTSGLLNDLFDDSFAIRRMNEIIKQKIATLAIPGEAKGIIILDITTYLDAPSI